MGLEARGRVVIDGHDVDFVSALEACSRFLYDDSDTEAVTVVVPLTDGQLFARLSLVTREEYLKTTKEAGK